MTKLLHSDWSKCVKLFDKLHCSAIKNQRTLEGDSRADAKNGADKKF